jgi:hypothetical protein
MPSIASTGSTALTQVQQQLQFARREASQADRNARVLEQRAQAAQRSADQEQSRADSLSAQATEAGRRSGMARRDLASVETAQQRGAWGSSVEQRTGQLLDAYA